ncbi:helix-turn-helix domain-containing protein [Hamadaea tsunoensis]|uniref:helix-turn-helix domain-containing protein n=1 Tax=Hamadaea tsunoensis TaxID=53368 RepID=UPI000403238B|nr:helix-turn-helix transcriptional regulator [Hamadaea tsunoensis]
MPQAPASLDPTLSAQHRFGAALRDLRADRGLSLAQLAPELPASPDALAKYERADRRPTRRIAETLDRVLAADGRLIELWDEADVERRAARRPQVANPQLVQHWNDLLSVLASSRNAAGGHDLMRIVSTEVNVISHYGGKTSGRVHLDFLRSQSRWLEFGSWIADNTNESAVAAAWLQKAGRLAAKASDATFGAYVVMRRAQRAAEAGQPRVSLNLVNTTEQSKLPPRVRALLLIRAAQARAAIGERPTALGHLRAAASLIDEAGASDPTDRAVAAHCTPEYIRAHEAQCLLSLGEAVAAAAIFEDVLRTWPSPQRLDEGLFRANLSIAYLNSGRPEQAIAQGRIALDLADQTQSRRTERVIGPLISDQRLLSVTGYEQLRARWNAAEGREAS